MNLENEIAFVTGASRGIGRAIAHELGKHGATVIGTATTREGADSITEYLKQAGIKGAGCSLEVTQADSIQAAVDFAENEFGRPSVLVNNAGITRDNLLMRMKDDEWDAVIETNLSANFRLVRAFLKGMVRARHGRIISIGSVVGSSGNPGQANYCAAKAGLIGFSKALAREVGSRNITVNVVAPGFIDTDMTKALPEEQRKALQQQIPLGKLGDAKDIANAVVFLASPSAAYITGETIHVNGGMYMG